MSLNCWLLPASGLLIFLPQWALFQKNLKLEAKTDTLQLSTLGWKEECQRETTDGRWHQLLGSSTLCFMLRGPRMNWQCPSQQILLARFPTVTPVRDLDYLAWLPALWHKTCHQDPTAWDTVCRVHAISTPVQDHRIRAADEDPSSCCILSLLFCSVIFGESVPSPVLPFPWLWLQAVWCRLPFSMKLHSVEPKRVPSSELKLQGKRQIQIASCFLHSRYAFCPWSSIAQ